MKLFQMSVAQIVEHFKTDQERGLAGHEAEDRLKKHGLNKFSEQRRETLLHVFVRQFQSPLIYILLLAAAIIFFVGQTLDAFIITGVLFFNAIVGTVQEGRTRTILESLRRFLKSDSVVIREGKTSVISDQQLVVGDLIVLQEGVRVPADARIIQASSLVVDEAMLTGESAGANKTLDVLSADVPIYEQSNMVFKGTYVLSGVGKAIVVATGVHTEVGKLNKAVGQVSAHMPLKQELERLSRWIVVFVLVICLLLLVIGLITGKSLSDLLVILTALFICVIPEGLPAVLTLVLVSGAYRMAKHKVLVKRFHAVEALGRIDTIVMDKTGTLTRNEMMVSSVYADEQMIDVSGHGYLAEGQLSVDGKSIEHVEQSTDLYLMGMAGALLNHAELTYLPRRNLFLVKGEPTEAAMHIFSEKMNIVHEKLEKEWQLLQEIPFDSQRGYHAEFYRAKQHDVLFVAGSPEYVMRHCSDVASKMRPALEDLLEQGLRVVAVGYREYNLNSLDPGSTDPLVYYDEQVSGLHLVGFFGIQDAIRQGVNEIVDQARGAGLGLIMVTGDHQQTALFVAKKTGIFRPGDQLLDGAEFNKLSKQQLLQRIDSTTVYSRVLPQNKLTIVQLLHERGKVVAMTGDGVNDVPSIVAADVGIAMGSIGTEVAKQAADVILLDDSFDSVIQGVKEGRHIFYTLKRVVLYFFATNMGEVLVILFALAANLPLPILAAQILWLNLITDGFLDIALATEPKEKDILTKEPPGKKVQLFDKHLLLKMMYMALPMGIGSLAVFSHYYQIDLPLARTMTLGTMAMFQWFNAWNCRSETRSVFQLGLFSNRWLLLALVVVFGLQFFIVYNPLMQKIFKTVPLVPYQWFIMLGVSSSIFIIEEIRKYCVQRFYFRA